MCESASAVGVCMDVAYTSEKRQRMSGRRARHRPLDEWPSRERATLVVAEVSRGLPATRARTDIPGEMPAAGTRTLVLHEHGAPRAPRHSIVRSPRSPAGARLCMTAEATGGVNHSPAGQGPRAQ